MHKLANLFIKTPKIKLTNKSALVVLSISVLLGISSCATEPDKLSSIEKVTSVKESLSKLHVDDSNKKFKINLQQAIGLALQNNLEYNLQKVQQALAYKQFDLAKTDMYPNLDMTYAYDVRNRDYVKQLSDAAGTSEPQSLVPHSVKTGNVLFNWNVLDLGLSYVRAKQAGDRYMLATEQRKQLASRTINQIIKNYTLAYYGQELVPQIKELEQSISNALEITDNAIEQGVGDKQVLLEYKKTLVEDYREAKDYLVYFQQSRERLLNYLNFNSKSKIEDTTLILEKPDNYLVKLPVVDSKLLYLDTVSLFYRPEVSEAIFKIRETNRQRYVVVLEKLPSFGFNLGYNYDSDKFLLHQNWWSHNMSIAWNILNMASIPAALDTADTQLEAAKLTHLASSAVVLGEIRVLLYNYKMKKYDYHLAEKESQFATSIYSHSLNMASAGMGDEQALVRHKLTAVNSELSKLKSFVDARNLFEDFVMALGMYSSEGNFVNNGKVDLSLLRQWMDRFNKNDFDNIIENAYKNINNNLKLSEVSDLHGDKSSEKPMQHKKENSGEEHHASLELNLPHDISKENTGNISIASTLNKYLTKLLSYTV